MNRQIYKMTLSDASDSITFYLLEVPIADDDITGTARNTTIDGNVYEDYLWLKKQWSQKWSIMCKDEYDKLRGIWKRQYTDSEVVSVKYFYGDNIYTDGEVEGNTMQINNDSEVYEGEIRAVKLLGNAEQTTYTGKNLMPILNIERTLNNVKFTPQADGSVLVNGTNNTANYAVYVLTFNTAENNVYRTVPAEAGTYYISNEGTIPSGVYVQCFTQITGQSVSQKNADGTFTVAQNFNFGCAIRVDAGTTVNNLIIKPMVEKSATKTSWEPYVGSTSSVITPSPNPDYPQELKTVSGGQTVKITGKNICSNTVLQDANNIRFYIAGITSNTITLSSIINVATASNSIYLRVDETDKGRIGSISGSAGARQTATLTLTDEQAEAIRAGSESYLLLYKSNAGFTLPTESMIELGNTATAYEPYQGQSQEINLGKNFVNITNADLRGTSDSLTLTLNSDGSVSYSGAPSPNTYAFLTAEINLALPAGTYTFSIGDAINSHANIYLRFKMADTTEEIVQIDKGVSSSITYTFTQATVSYILAFRGMTVGTQISGRIYPQLEAGNSQTSYAPYKTPLELAKIGTYQDYIWNDDGTWKIHKEVGKAVLTGSEAGWSLSNVSAGFTRAGLTGLTSPEQAGMCDNFTPRTGAHGAYEYIWFRAASIGGGCFIQINTTRLSDNTLDAFKTWLSTHNTTVYYALATPTDTEITDAELVGQLDALLAGSLYKGLNNVFLIPSAGAQGTMTLDYRINYEKETVVQDTTPVLLDLTDDGIINACQCRQNVKITMRETVQ